MQLCAMRKWEILIQNIQKQHSTIGNILCGDGDEYICLTLCFLWLVASVLTLVTWMY